MCRWVTSSSGNSSIFKPSTCKLTCTISHIGTFGALTRKTCVCPSQRHAPEFSKPSLNYAPTGRLTPAPRQNWPTGCCVWRQYQPTPSTCCAKHCSILKATALWPPNTARCKTLLARCWSAKACASLGSWMSTYQRMSKKPWTICCRARMATCSLSVPSSENPRASA